MADKLNIRKLSPSGKLHPTYHDLLNMLDENGELTSFSTNSVDYDFSNPLDIDFQYSYDDSVNLILNNGFESPRLINSRFVKLENNTYEFINRNQGCATNLYDSNKIESQTDLFLRSFKWPIFDLRSVDNGGQLMCGNYVFYIKYADEDDNLSDIMSESGAISIFSGDLPSLINGNLLDTRTSKLIRLKISNIDTNFSKFYLYFTRETSDTNGVSLTKCYKILTPYDIKSQCIISITGYESIEEISVEELNIQYNYYNTAKTQAIVQNMLFLGNVKQTKYDSSKLAQLSFYIDTNIKQKEKSIGYIDERYNLDSSLALEYYDPKNIYYYLGYWPDEFYQLGVVYLLNDGTSTKAYPLRGRNLNYEKSYISIVENNENIKYSDIPKLEINTIIDKNTLENTGGIFKTNSLKIFDHKNRTTHPLYFEFSLHKNIISLLKEEGVRGLMFVRTKRSPTSLFQGLSCPVDKLSGLIAPYVNDNGTYKYIIESFLTKKGTNNEPEMLIYDDPNKQNIYLSNTDLSTSALLSVDPIVVPKLQTLLTWNNYKLHGEYICDIQNNNWSRTYTISNYKELSSDDESANLVFISKDIPAFFIKDFYFSTRAGNAETVLDFSFVGSINKEEKAANLARGVYCPIIGCSKRLLDSAIYTVKFEYDDVSWITSLLNNNTEYYSITNRYELNDFKKDVVTIDAYRGDCFTTTTTIRLNRNFLDPTFPANDTIVDPKTWDKNYKGISNMISTSEKHPDVGDGQGDWTAINLGDINAARLGRWITFKTLSNYNLGLRSIDKSDINTLSKLGTYRSFYPISGISTRSANKVDDSELLNEGYSITLSRKRYGKWVTSPYENFHFENRIAFSNVASTKMFVNGFRIFQGLSYKDIDRQFGSITKLMPYGQNLLCIFEHGVGIIPINEKALMSTQEGLSIHLYGAGVLQEQVSVISQDFGSTWSDSIIKTPDAYYGVDSNARKIWKFNNTSGFVCISDFKIQSYLNDIDISNIGEYFFGATNIKTHYNNFNGDVIFTFYTEDRHISITYNERTNIWVSRNSWIPLLSANINSNFYSYNFKTVNELSKILKQTTKNKGLVCNNYVIDDNGIIVNYKNEFFKNVNINISSLKYSLNVNNKLENYIVSSTKGYLITKLEKNIRVPVGVCVIDNEGNKRIYSIEFSLKCRLYNNTYQSYSENEKNDFVWIDNEYLKSRTSTYEIHDDIEVSTVVDNNKCAFITNYSNSEYKLYIHKDFVYNSDIHIPVKIVLNVFSNDVELENHEFSFTTENINNFKLSLYRHDINSPITKWYGNQEPFEYEFVVNQPAGLSKIFNNLVIISNNVEPDSLEVDIIGDIYDFPKEEILNKHCTYNFPIINLTKNNNSPVYKTTIYKNKVTSEYHLIMHQDCLNIKNFGRRIGNISYIEGKWNIVLQPIYYTQENEDKKVLKTTRLRDKWAKIRIKYTGEKLAIITAIQTLMNISYV